jgi:hypothetical protein
MGAKPGDRIVVEAEKATQSGRGGVIEQVVQEDPPRYQVRWDDGRTSIVAPSDGAARIEPRRKKSR